MATTMFDMTIDQFMSLSGISGINQTLTNFTYGINHARVSMEPPRTKLTYGWTFFTRPQLNLRTENIRNIREFYILLNKNPLSVPRVVRVLLDPRLPFQLLVNGDISKYYSNEIITCPLVDKHNPFIPILTNSIKSVSGWPDETVSAFTSNPGIRKEQFAMTDGTYETNEVFDITCTFRNFKGEILQLLFQTWVRYQSLVFEGMLQPYWDMVLENEIDYNTRIWRINTDSSWEYLSHIAATGAAFPIVNPIGRYVDYDKSKPYNEQISEYTMRFKAIGAMYDDPILIKEFNVLHSYFNPLYKAYLEGNDDVLIEIPKDLRRFLNFRGYPYIDPNTYKIKWLIPKEDKVYKDLVKKSDKDLDKLLKEMDKEEETDVEKTLDDYYQQEDNNFENEINEYEI